MSSKRILGITIFSILFIAIAVGVMLHTSFLGREHDAVQLPDTSASSTPDIETEPDTLDRVDVTRENVQEVVSSLLRPETYRRNIIIQSHWDSGHTDYHISVSVTEGVTSLRRLSPTDVEKRIIVAPDKLYIWYGGDNTVFIGSIDSTGDGHRTADEWQMLIAYEDILRLDVNDIIDVGYVEYNGEDCIYAKCLSPLLGYTRIHFISVAIGLVVGAEEYDRDGKLVYSMTVGDSSIGSIDPADFTLPDGSLLIGSGA